MDLNKAFGNLFYDLGVVNSNHENNMNFIQSLGEVIGEDLNKSRLVLNSLSNNEYTIDFNRGREDQKCKVIIMTVHSSKGLEFENVILGGIHTNGRAKPFKDPFGKIPASLKWKSKVGQRKFFKSPNYILESHISSQKDFSESKRLFYVACTRAKKGPFLDQLVIQWEGAFLR